MLPHGISARFCSLLQALEHGRCRHGARIPSLLYPTVRELLHTYQQQWKDFAQKSVESLKSRCQIAMDAGVQAEYTQTVGKPGKTICDLAKNWEADLILMGRRGYSALGELVLGSVSQYVVHHGPCSVLIVQSHPA